MYDEPIALQWKPADGSRHRLSFEPSEDGWHMYEAVWDGQQWCETSFEVVEQPAVYAPDHATDVEPEPTILEALLDEIKGTWWDDPQVLVFEGTELVEPIVVAMHRRSLRYYSGQLVSWHPADRAAIRNVIRDIGVPTVRPLSETPYTKEQLTSGESYE